MQKDRIQQIQAPETAHIRNYRNAEIQIHTKTNRQDTEIQKYKTTKIHTCKSTTLQKYNNTNATTQKLKATTNTQIQY